MKKVVLLVLSAVLFFSVGTADAKGRTSSSHSHKSYSSGSHAGHQSVRGYTKKTGKHVNTYHRTYADHNFNNNWSTKGNVNPDTGKKGYKTHPYKKHH